jgi:hypothetical protein
MSIMNENTDSTDKTAEQWTAFQKIWGDTFTRLMQLGFTFSPESAPPEFMRQMRAGILQGLSQAWDQFLRSPQFLEGMKQWMDNAMAFRKLTNDFLAKARHETQSTSRDDIDSLMLAVRHMETRVLDRVEELTARVEDLNKRLDQKTGARARPKRTPAASGRRPKKAGSRQRK